jgi:hypothetical protein
VSEVITDAALIQQLASKAMEEPAAVIKTEAPSASEVQLPGGFIEQNGELITTAEVKELTGADEEAIARAGSSSKSFNVLLQRGLVKLGSRDVRKEDLENLLSGDRDSILLGIRRVTFGKDLKLAGRCGSCNSEQTLVIDLIKDVPVKALENPIEDRVWDVEISSGVARVALPTGTVQKKLVENVDKTSAEINTLLLTGCILSVNNRPSSGAFTALNLGMADRSKIIDELLERNPGPRLGEVKKACQACGEDIALPLSLLDLFRF